MNLDAWKIDPLSQVLGDGVGMVFASEPVPEAPKVKKPRAKKAPAEPVNPDDVLTLLQTEQPEILIEEDTTPHVWDGTLPEPPYPWMRKNDWKLVTSMDELWAWWADIQADTANHVPSVEDILHNTGKKHPKIGFDTETTGLDNRLVLGHSKIHIAGFCLASYTPGSSPYDVCYAPNDLRTEVPMKRCTGLYIPVAHERWGQNLSLQDVLDFLKVVFASAIIVTHNGKYDKLVVDNACPMTMREVPFHNYTEKVYERLFPNFPQYPFWVDTQSLWFMIDSNNPRNGLKDGANTFLNQPMIEFDEVCDSGIKKPKSKKNYLLKFTQVPPFKAVHYAAADAINTLQLSDCFAYIANQIPFINQIDHLIINNSAWLETQRPLIDRDYLLDEERFLAFKCEHTLKQIHRIAGCEVNPDSPSALGDILFVKMGLPNKGKTAPSRVHPTGSWKTDKDTMAELAAENPEHAIFNLIVAYREYRNAYPRKLYHGTDPLDSSAKITLQACRAPTGRFACTGGDFEEDGGCGLNIQAQKALYSVRNIDVLALDTVKYLGVDGLDSTSMFDPKLFEWLRNHVKPVTMVQYPNKAAIKDYYKAVNPSITDDELSAQVKAHIKAELASNKEKGYSTLKEGLQVLNLQDNATVINNHVKLTPDSWVCMLHECSHCMTDETLPLHRYEIEYDYSETMNLRRAFVSPPGWTFFSIDYGAIELRMVTNLAGEKLWIEGFVGGKDLHASMAEAVFQEKFRNADATTKSDLRSSAKTITFGNLYGGTARTIQDNLEMPVTFDEAKVLYNNWIGAIPYYSAWVKAQKTFVNQYKRVFTAFGRIRNLMKEMNGDHALRAYGERTALNHPSQGSAADILRVALNRIQQWILANNLQDVVRLHFHVHDELNLSCKDEWVPFIIPNVLRLLRVDDLIKQLQWPVPLDCDVEYGPSWSVVAKFWDYAKGKGAKWSKIESLAGMNQDSLKQLYDSIIQGAEFSADMYRASFLPAIYAHWDAIGYVDPYKDFVEKRQSRFEKMQVWVEKNPGKWPTVEDLDSLS